ncbi:Ig-like domain-containing protein [Methylobacterium nigriterrae]|uniref:Ig-like domain-containing protein n=1 Tax=Methylobacterium nigriterrae TaxID=3127512 RepID=UPI003013E177
MSSIFLANADYDTDNYPYAVAAADLNGDGKLDLVTVNDVNSVSVLLGKGDATFQDKQAFATGPTPYSVAAADLNSDGKLDLVTANSGSDTISVLLGNGNGTFQAPQDVSVGTNPASVVALDLNGDGKIDLVATNGVDNRVSVLLGNGNGTFQTAQFFSVGAAPWTVGAADLNGDGKLDLFTANYNVNSVSVLLGNGNGTFQAAQSIPTGAGPYAAIAADLNGDGRIDLVTANGAGNTVSVLLGNGNGTFQAKQDYATGSTPDSVVAADVNGDGKIDLVTANSGSGSISVLLGNGNGTFQPKQDFTTGNATYALAAADLNHDGNIDLVAANASADGTAGISVLLNASPPVDTTPPTLTITSSASQLKIGQSATITFAFTEDPGSSFTYGDVAVTGGTLGPISGSGLVRTATFTPSANTNGGTATITVAAGAYTDAAGNAGGAGPSPSLHFDTRAPTLTITSDHPVLKIGETATITFSFSEDPDSSFIWDGTSGDVVVTGGTLSALSGTGTTRTAIFTPSADVDGGSASITVAAGSYTDGTGNTGGAGASPSMTFDTKAPSAPSAPDLATSSDAGTSSTDNLTNSTTPTVTGTADAGATVTLYDIDGTTVLGSTVATGGSYSIISSALSAGTHLISATATDAAGNVSAASAGLLVSIDTTPPTLAITSDRAVLKAGEAATISFTFSEDPGATFTWDGISGDVAVIGGTLGAISGTGLVRTATFTPTVGVNGGTAGITVAAGTYTDAAGNTGTAGATPSLLFDTLAPEAPSAPALTLASDTGASHTDGITSLTTPAITGTAEAGTAVTLYDTDGVTVLGSATATGGNYSITSSTLAQGAHTLSVKATDAAGNVSSASATFDVTIDTTAPTLAITSDTTQLKVGESATITFTFSEDPGSSFAQGGVTVSGGTLGPISGSGLTRTATFTPTADTNGGTGSVTVAAGSYTDAAGNGGGTGAAPGLHFDTRAPAAPSTPDLETGSDSGASPTDRITKITTPTVTGTAEAGSTVTLYDTDGTTVLGSATASGSIYSITSAALSEGNHTLTVKATDAAGNISVASSGLVVTVDTVAPALSVTSSGGTVYASTQLITGTVPDSADIGTTVTLREGSTVLGTAVVQADHTWNASVDLGTYGAHAITVSDTDAAGNTGQAQVSYILAQPDPGPDTNGSLTQSPAAGETLTLSGKTDGSLEKDGAGTLVITGTNTYTGPTTVQAGLLLVDGSITSPVTVQSGAVLGGHGSTGTVTIESGGTLSPGNSPGVLSTQDLSLAAGAVLKEEIGGTAAGQFDQLHVTGSVNLGGATLNAVAYGSFVSARGDSFVFIDNDGTDAVSGTFAGLNEGASLSIGSRSYQISYHGGDDNDVVLTDITVPGAATLALFCTVEHSTASQAGGVYALYEALLDRAPDPLGLEGFTTALKTGMSLTDVAQVVLTSPEHGPQAQSTTAYVESLYANLLNRHSDPGGLAFYTDELAHGTGQAQVAVQIATSAEGQANIKPAFDAGVFVPDASDAAVARLYYGLLDRAPDAGGLQSFEAVVKQAAAMGGVPGAIEALKSVSGAMLASPEYVALHGTQTNAQFVDAVYGGALGRHADTTGLGYWQDALAHGVSRADVALGIAQSQEAQIHLVSQIEAGWHLVA